MYSKEVLKMSRIGKKPIQIPEKVEVKIENGVVKVKGPKGELSYTPHPQTKIEIKDKEITVSRPSDKKFFRALHGTTRQIIANMIKGVSEGFVKELEIIGTGYRVRKEGTKLVLHLGFASPKYYTPPPDVKVEVEGENKIKVSGIDKQKVGQVAAEIRAIKPPEPYKGKGIRYVGEYVRKKAGKAGVKAQA